MPKRPGRVVPWDEATSSYTNRVQVSLIGLLTSVLAGRDPNEFYLDLGIQQTKEVEIYNGPNGEEPCNFKIGPIALLPRTEWRPSRFEQQAPWCVISLARQADACRTEERVQRLEAGVSSTSGGSLVSILRYGDVSTQIIAIGAGGHSLRGREAKLRRLELPRHR